MFEERPKPVPLDLGERCPSDFELRPRYPRAVCLHQVTGDARNRDPVATVIVALGDLPGFESSSDATRNRLSLDVGEERRRRQSRVGLVSIPIRLHWSEQGGDVLVDPPGTIRPLLI